jgi:MFS family permease
MYSVYSIPNTVLVFFGGMIGDRIGLRISSLIFVSFVCLGTVFVALGPTILHMRQAWMMMVAGRVLLGSAGNQKMIRNPFDRSNAFLLVAESVQSR